jgi:TldD protein
VLPVMVWRVYPDGRPDELVRGVDIVGTPLAALTHITITGDKQDVFNGVCGAESGWVPVSAVAPSMLFSEMEVQKRAKSHTRPPILAPPGFESTATAPTKSEPANGVKP